MNNNSTEAYDLGQSLWYDNIQRQLLKNGELKNMIESGEIYGVTSNPSIFHNAIANSEDYDSALIPLAQQGKSALDIYETLAVADIKEAADQFMPLYQSTNGGDGYVSLEVNPTLANKTDETIEEAARLWKLVNRPNLMIKIPATLAGIPAVKQTIAAGINVNVTLIFSQERYQEVMQAYLEGLETRIQAEQPISNIASVASFFISRIDTKADGWLEDFNKNREDKSEIASSLQGKIAIANAKAAYQSFKQNFESDRFKTLQNKGAKIQRPLWASTSTKNPSYPDTLYVDELIGPDTVNTIPPKTLTAFNHHGTPMLTLGSNLDEAMQALEDFETIGLSLSQATQELEEEGVTAFSNAFEKLLQTIDARRETALQ